MTRRTTVQRRRASSTGERVRRVAGPSRTRPRRWSFGIAAVLAVATATLPAGAQSVDVAELTVADVQQGYLTGAFTAVELTRAYLDRIERYESLYNAFISMNPDAVAEAAALDAELAVTGLRGPLHGVPVVIKDNIDQAGLVTTAGFEGFSAATGGVDLIPGTDAEVVRRLRDAGAIVLGKTNLPDFAAHGTRTNSSVAGITLNPYDITRVPGGSSGGTATAVNAGFAVLGLGTETGGSIQNPAAAQGLVGLKPTYGLVPLAGVMPLAGSYVDVVGPLTRSVRDAAVVLDVIAGPSPEDLATYASVDRMPEDGYVAGLGVHTLAGKRFGLVGEGWRDSWLPLDPSTQLLYRDAVGTLEALGAEVVEDPFLGSGFVELYGERPSVPSQRAHGMAVYLSRLGDEAPFDSIEEWEALTGRRLPLGRREPGRRAAPTRPSATEQGDAYQAWRSELRALFRDVMDAHRLDGLFFPQAAAPTLDLFADPDRPDYEPNDWPEIPSNMVNDLGVPVLTVPAGLYDDGMPFVVAFIGDMWTEDRLLGYGYDFERVTSARVSPILEEGPSR